MKHTLLLFLALLCGASTSFSQWVTTGAGTKLEAGKGPLLDVTLHNPVLSGTPTLVVTGSIYANAGIASPALSGTASGALTGGTFVSATLTAPVFGGTASGILTGGTLAVSTISNPTFTGTSSGGTFATATLPSPAIATAVFSGTNTGQIRLGGTLTILSGTAASPVTGSVGVSGTTLYFYDGTVWKNLSD